MVCDKFISIYVTSHDVSVEQTTTDNYDSLDTASSPIPDEEFTFTATMETTTSMHDYFTSNLVTASTDFEHIEIATHDLHSEYDTGILFVWRHYYNTFRTSNTRVNNAARRRHITSGRNNDTISHKTSVY